MNAINANTQTAATLPVTTSAPMQGKSQQIRKALLTLFNIADRDAWQTELIAVLLRQANPDTGYDALADDRLDGMMAGLNLYFRFFEVRPDLTFKHQPEKFDAAGFLPIGNPWTYADQWWSTVPDQALRMTESLLEDADILEFREIQADGESVIWVRLRADRIVDILNSNAATTDEAKAVNTYGA